MAIDKSECCVADARASAALTRKVPMMRAAGDVAEKLGLDKKPLSILGESPSTSCEFATGL